MEEGDEKMGDCPHDYDAQAQKSHGPGSVCTEGEV